MRTRVLVAAGVTLVGVLAGCGQGGGVGGMTGGSGRGPDEVGATPVVIGLVTKTDDNPYFIRIRQAAIAAAGQWRGARIEARAGKFDGDNDGQVAAVNELVGMGVKGILITPSNSAGIVPALAEARKRGVVVVALDTETDPLTAADATFETRNDVAGRLQGMYLKSVLGPAAPQVAMLDGSPGSTVDAQRHQGFLRGMGVAEGDPAIVAAVPTDGDAARAEQAMSALLVQHPDLNAVYTVNEPVAEGARRALAAAGATGRVALTTIDGSCPGVLSVRERRYAADVMQFPTAMASAGVDAVMRYVTGGVRPPSGIQDTGSRVVADQARPGVDSQDTGWGLTRCWG